MQRDQGKKKVWFEGRKGTGFEGGPEFYRKYCQSPTNDVYGPQARHETSGIVAATDSTNALNGAPGHIHPVDNGIR